MPVTIGRGSDVKSWKPHRCGSSCTRTGSPPNPTDEFRLPLVSRIRMTTTPFRVDPAIAQASTIPSRAYFDPAVYAAARERIFARSWQPVGEVGRLKAPGHVIPSMLLGRDAWTSP